MPDTRKHPRGLMLIAAFKLLKGLSLLAVGIAVHMLANKDLVSEAQHWGDLFRVDPHNHYLNLLIEKLTTVDAHKLRALSLGTFVYSALFLTEGVGLFLRKRWAEFLTIISTAGLIPLEIYELYRRLTFTRILLLVVNIGVVFYLIYEIRRLTQAKRASSGQ
ncbi:MAG TPA: DUF2127 domain-containing protein [Candidatus Dormibacteraeota bacterium]|jgi:uncharacterized membrane protein (DUF2068 family)|nr:DUF2127 domain-containing protein [Candidatus Dormibacteraeota bacterium]